MGHQTQLANALRARGVKVEEYSGWTTRGSSDFHPDGGVCHWTAGPCGATGRPSLSTCVNGRPDLAGPLCNVYLDRNGVAVVVAAGRANHAGSGGWHGLSGNSSVFGVEAECCNAGDWTSAQRTAYPKVMAALCDAGGYDSTLTCGHNEWAEGRKVDIHDWPMSTMRSQVADLLNDDGGDWFDMATKDELASVVRAELNRGTGQGQKDWAGTSKATLGQVQSHTNKLNSIQSTLNSLVAGTMSAWPGYAVALAVLIVMLVGVAVGMAID